MDKLLPDDVGDGLRSRQGVSVTEYLNEWCVPFVSSEIEWVAPFDEIWGCGGADCGLSFYPSCSAISRRRGPQRPVSGGERASKGCQNEEFSRDADVGAQRTQRNSWRSRARRVIV